MIPSERSSACLNLHGIRTSLIYEREEKTGAERGEKRGMAWGRGAACARTHSEKGGENIERDITSHEGKHIAVDTSLLSTRRVAAERCCYRELDVLSGEVLTACTLCRTPRCREQQCGLSSLLQSTSVHSKHSSCCSMPKKIKERHGNQLVEYLFCSSDCKLNVGVNVII